MILTLTVITFVATIVIIGALLYALSPTAQPVADRLARLANPQVQTEEVTFRDRQKQRAERVLGDVGKLIPASHKSLSRTKRMMVRAGYRRPESIMVMQGIKLLLPIVLAAGAFFSGLYKQNPMMLIIALAIGFIGPEYWLTRKIRRRQHRLRLALPDALDLLVICVEAGLALDQAILRVSQELRLTHPELTDEFHLLNLEMRVGKKRIDALRELGDRTGVDDIKGLVAMLIQTDRFGTSLAQSLRVHSDSLRTKRRQRAEEAAAKTTVKMVPPLVFFIFPALFVVILGPAVITLMRQFGPATGQ
jgi:tight adherence protein C